MMDCGCDFISVQSQYEKMTDDEILTEFDRVTKVRIGELTLPEMYEMCARYDQLYFLMRKRRLHGKRVMTEAEKVEWETKRKAEALIRKRAILVKSVDGAKALVDRNASDMEFYVNEKKRLEQAVSKAEADLDEWDKDREREKSGG